jgi:hypothetical protein
MITDLSKIDRDSFMVHEHLWNGELLHLVQPNHIGTKFDQTNKIFRSSVWNADGELVSACYPKFVNWGENPDNFPVPTSLDDATIVEKIDGSALIVSKYKGNVMIRTRGTLDATRMDNGHEIEIFKETILPKLDTDGMDTWKFSYIFEWTSPENRIVIRYGDKPDWYFTGIVYHGDYSLMSQDYLDKFANFNDLKRPATYTFTTIADLLENVEKWVGKEGVCLYKDQGIWKIKSSDYLIKHRLKEEFGSLEKVLEFFVSEGCPDYGTFYNKVAEIVSFETAEECRGDISKCIDAWKEVEKILDHMAKFCSHLQDKALYPTRKEQALKVLSSYGTTNRAAFCFKLLDGKMLGKEDHVKLMWQILKK